jgi:sulfoxide reductase heme-binding subunit YedZ
VAGVKADWYLTRGSGAVALILLTITVVLGVAEIGRLASRRWPRFAVDGLHRSSSLLAFVFLTIHILTAVIDSFAPISLADAFVPFIGAYRPLWLGLGAVAFDLLLAVALTSVVRVRLGHRAWRAVHWLAYASWPIAVLHGLGTGSDVRQSWMSVVYLVCGVAVLVAVFVRSAIGWPSYAARRVLAATSAAAFALALVVWLPGGPLSPGWARRSGTPTRLLAPTDRPTGRT